MKTKTIRSLTLAILALSLTANAFTGCGRSGEGAETKAEASGSSTLEQKKSEPGEAELRNGLAACDKKDYEAAVKSFLAAADQGNTDAMLLYSDCLAKGNGIGKDMAASEEWLKKAAEAGNTTAQALYGRELLSRKKEAEGIEFMKQSAKSGNIVGMYLLGMVREWRLQGIISREPAGLAGETEEDVRKYLKKVASLPLSEQKTVPDFLSQLDGGIDLKGKPNTNMNRLIVMSQYMLGMDCLNGRTPAERDLDEAAKWLNMAKDNGLPQAESALAIIERQKQSPPNARPSADAGRDEQDARIIAVLADEQSRIDASEFDLQFTITDNDGKPLDGVKMELKRERPKLPLLSGEWERKMENGKTVGSKFRIQEKGWTKLELTFTKDGYYLESRMYSINILSDALDGTRPKLLMKEDIQVILYKGVPIADLCGTNGRLVYDFEKGRKTLCDLSAFGKKPDKPKKTAVSEDDEEDDYDEAEEDEEEYVEEEIKIEMKSVDLKTKPELTKYIELDFKRDENGEVLFDGMLRDTPCPATFIIRLHSDDPGDGFIPVDKLGPGFIRPEEYDKRYTTAPETGYQKELVFDFGKQGADGKFPYETNYLFAFVKCGQHYGKVYIHPANHDGRLKTIQQVRVRFEQLVFNQTEGDRNVSSLFFVEPR